MAADTKWKFSFTDADVRTIMRALDYVITRAENTESPKFAIDTICRRECVIQWQRLKAEFYQIVGDEE